MKKRIFLYLVFSAIQYSAISFVLLETNPIDWSENARIFATLTHILVIIIAYTFKMFEVDFLVMKKTGYLEAQLDTERERVSDLVGGVNKNAEEINNLKKLSEEQSQWIDRRLNSSSDANKFPSIKSKKLAR